MRLRSGVIGLLVLAVAPASALGVNVKIDPLSSRQPAPAPALPQLPQQDVFVSFNVPVVNPTQTGGSWVVQEIFAGGVLGFPLPGAVASQVGALDGKSWKLSFAPLFFGSNATYRVTLTNVRPTGPNTAMPLASWDFTTAPEPGKAPGAIDGLSATAGDGSVAVSWTEPTDFDRAGVMIFRKAGAAVPTTADELVGTFAEGVTSAVDANVQAGATYTYAAFPYDRDNPANIGPPVLSMPVSLPAPPAQTAPPAPSPAPSAPPATTPTPQPQSKKTVVTSKLVLPASSTLIKGKTTRLRWKRNARAAYYNVQLFKGRRKLLSTFPNSASASISGQLLRAAGTYRLLIWSGLGSRTLGRYERSPWVTKTLIVKASGPAKKV